jgi:hypothetical protein
MDEEKLIKNAKTFIEILKNLNKITKLLYQEEIQDFKSLIHDIVIYDSLCHSALKIYELYAETLGIKDSTCYKDHRAELTHITKNLRKGIGVGFDESEPEEIWNKHFNPCNDNAAIPKIKNTIESKLKADLSLAKMVEKLSRTDYEEPIKLYTDNDFAHLKIHKRITKQLDKDISSIAGLLSLMSDKTEFPSKVELLSAIKLLFNTSDDDFNYAIKKLEQEGIIVFSANNKYIFFKDKSYKSSIIIEFIENNDLTRILELLRNKQ